MAARSTLIQDGFSHTSARAIAARAGCSQASLFYHFAGVNEVLLEVLDEVSERRMRTYREPLLEARTPGQLARLGRRIAAEDIRSGDLRVLVELLTGATTVPGMKAEVARRIVPWEDLVAEVIARYIPVPVRPKVKPAALAHAIVAGFLGLELLRDLREDETGTEAVLDALEKVGRIAAPAQGGAS